MKRLFTGLIFISLDFNLNLENCVIGLFPDWLGYLFLMGGLVEMASESGHFLKVRPLAVGMAVYTAVLYAMDLLGLSFSLGYAAIALGLFSSIISLYILFHIVQGVIDMERENAWNVNGAPLFTIWKIMAVCNVLSYVFLAMPPLLTMSVIVCSVAGIVFLVGFYKARVQYEACPHRYAPDKEEAQDSINKDGG